jgi:hypothetical protein
MLRHDLQVTLEVTKRDAHGEMVTEEVIVSPLQVSTSTCHMQLANKYVLAGVVSYVFRRQRQPLLRRAAVATESK